MDTFEEMRQEIVNIAQKNKDPLCVESCGCIFTDETAIVCSKHFESMPNDW